MDEHTTFLDALTRRGVLLSVSVRFWRARRKLNAEDLGLSRDSVSDRLFSLGHKRLVPKESLKRLKLLESRAHSLAEENTFAFLGGLARYLPNSRLEEVHSKLRSLKAEFDAEAGDFVSRYAQVRESALDEWREAASSLAVDPSRLVAAVREAFPPPGRLPGYFGFEIRLFHLAVPDAPAAQLVELGDQMELSRARREAAAQAKREIETSCREFIADCVTELRTQTARLCSEMLDTVSSTGNVHQKTLNRLVRFIDRFGDLNFADDTAMEQELARARSELLSRTAGEYRDSESARTELVEGLNRLRGKAAELASGDAAELVESFGSMGRRRFALSA